MTNQATNEHEPTIDEQQELLPFSVGQMLQEARTAEGMTVEQVANRLKLRVSLISELEQDNFDNIPNNTYVKGYVTNYARVVGLNVSDIQAVLQQQLIHTDHDMTSFSRKTSKQALDKRITLVSYLVFLVLFCLLVLWWIQRDETPVGPDFSQAPQEELAAQVAVNDPIEPMNESERLLQEAAQLESSLTSIAVDAQSDADASITSVEADKDNASEPEATAAIEPEYAVLLIKVAEECWMQVSDASGSMLVNGLKKSGSQIEVSVQPPLNFVIGAPNSVSITLNGETVDLSQYQDRVARFTYPLGES
ncbi:RodZ domain-containing protein [Paraferrimonas haliotis]|uniref:Membrane protein n=1 Tax=Paraferrimonas haliotis TaxID=2013866 RepID=A0AA37TTC3_9GAMM|nr:RodZ domain-containing protein [Paraferrimonas haliotis]GLS84042.1 membrane protein [Paraferrimonas haliotis]